ncbi:MAG: MFS transporter [Rhodocyclaceae bacterium]|nr:MAG: MFS transporter [Rhodocyclaceae bacterium]
MAEEGHGGAVGRKVTIRLIVPFLILIILNSIDRVNVSFAALRMNSDIGLTPATYGFGVSLFFVAYIAFQVPSLWLLNRYGMRRWIFAVVLTWGCIATGMAFIQGEMGFYLLRFALGAAEAGFAPGVVLCCTRWMPRRFRAGSISLTMMAIPISIIIGGPLSGWLMEQQNTFDMPGWRWLFLVEGAPTVIAAIVALWLFVDTPAQAEWLTNEEKQWLTAELAREAQVPVSAGGVTKGMLIKSGRVWACALAWLSLLAGAYGLIYWLPLIIKELSRGSSDLTVGMLSALPWLGVAAGMIINAQHSDRTQERHWHVIVPSLICAGGLALAAVVGSGWGAMSLLVVSGFALGAAQGTFWAIPTTFLTAGAAALGIPMINMIGGFGGVIGPGMIGWVKQTTGSYALPVYAMAAMLVMGALLVYLIRPPSVRQ